jgi:hypothetical protein
MSRTLTDLDQEVTLIRRELDSVKALLEEDEHPVFKFAGCFTGDKDWEKISEDIQRARNLPEEVEYPEVDRVAA